MLANVKVGSIIRDKKHDSLWRCTAVRGGGKLSVSLITTKTKDGNITSTLFSVEDAEMNLAQPGQVWGSSDKGINITLNLKKIYLKEFISFESAAEEVLSGIKAIPQYIPVWECICSFLKKPMTMVNDVFSSNGPFKLIG